tara:strand:- start:67 stop:309 length:243 start_codon:yes stop_codon:yes gene_type:complete
MSEETINYLIYDTEADAIARADIEGARRGYAYHNTPDGVSRYHTYPQKTADEKYALDVTEYDLTEDEQAAITTSVTFPTE